MTVLENVSEWLQISSLFQSFILGVCFEVLFEVFHQVIIRTSNKYKRLSSIICDSIFIFIITVITHNYMLGYSYGKIRFFIILGEIIGFVLCYFTLGRLLRTINNFIIESIFKKFIRLVKNISIKIYNFICKTLSKIKHFIKKPQKVVKNTWNDT